MGGSQAFDVVFFFNDQGVDKEMMLPEFESFLDGLIPAPELAGKSFEAAYVTVDSSLKVTGIVFFLFNFDSKGLADSKWNLPLMKMMASGVDGPDLGAGPAKIYMKSSSAHPEYRPFLWDPAERGGSNDLVHIRDAVRRNRLCLSSADEEEQGWMGDASMVMDSANAKPDAKPETKVELAPEVKGVAIDFSLDEPIEELDADPNIPVASSTLASDDNEELSQAIRIIESQRAKIASLENSLLSKQASNAAAKELKALQAKYAGLEQELSKSREGLSELAVEKVESDKSIKDLTKQLQAAGKAQEKSEAALEKAKKSAQEKIESLKSKYEQSSNAELEKQEKRFSKRIKELEKECVDIEKRLKIAHTEELADDRAKMESISKELTTLRGDKFRLMKDGAEAFFKKLADADVSFMSFKPGAGHLTIDPDDMGRFLEDPDPYVADKCGVSLEDYRIWLKHYNSPICQAPMPGEQVCGKSVLRTDVPSKFNPGSSDRCKSHGGQ